MGGLSFYKVNYAVKACSHRPLSPFSTVAFPVRGALAGYRSLCFGLLKMFRCIVRLEEIIISVTLSVKVDTGQIE